MNKLKQFIPFLLPAILLAQLTGIIKTREVKAQNNQINKENIMCYARAPEPPENLELENLQKQLKDLENMHNKKKISDKTYVHRKKRLEEQIKDSQNSR